MSEIIAEPKDKCPNCWKKPSLCLCEEIQVVKASHEVLILQHPQESRNPLTTARLISLTLPKTTHKVGFSWRSLSKALGRENVDPKSWAVLYLGTTKKMENLKPLPFQVVTSHGEPVSPKTIRGVVILDGNWSQVVGFRRPGLRRSDWRFRRTRPRPGPACHRPLR